MPTYVNSEKCDGFRVLQRPARMYIRPMDSMKLEASATLFGEEKYPGVDILPVPNHT